MDLTSAISNFAGGVSGKAGQALSFATSFLTPYFGAKELERANAEAQKRISSGYDEAGNYVGEGYQKGEQYLREGTERAAGEIGTGYEQGIAAQQPYSSYGEQGLKTLADLGKERFSFDYTQDSGYQARLKEGQEAIAGSAAAKAGLLSSGTLKYLNKYSQEFASNEYGNAFNRAMDTYKTDTSKRFDVGRSLAGYGQTAAGNISSMYTDRGTAMGNLYSTQGSNLANMATGYGTTMGEMSIGESEKLADLAVDRGNIKAGKVAGYGQAASGLGSNLIKYGEERLLSKMAPVTRV
jgi:hypothetical protein